MSTRLVTFSDDSMSRSAESCLSSGVRCGATSVCGYEHTDMLETAFYRQNEALLSQPRGLGMWAWKPALIYGELIKHDPLWPWNSGDILIYADAGIEFINNVNYIIDRMDQDIFLFGNNWEHAHWCKRDIIEAICPCVIRPTIIATPKERLIIPWVRYGKQVQASVIFFRVSDYTRAFVKEWLDWCLFEGGRLIDDSPSRTPNHPEFRENRHDQAILTTMAYRDGIKLHYWPASYNDGAFTYEKLPEYASDDYPILFNHHRKRNHEWEQVA